MQGLLKALTVAKPGADLDTETGLNEYPAVLLIQHPRPFISPSAVLATSCGLNPSNLKYLATINPKQRLSYQYHHKRQEQWVVVIGRLSIVLDGNKLIREASETISIPLGSHHRAWNETEDVVVFIEVQTGTYFGEDDIVRISDDYKRC